MSDVLVSRVNWVAVRRKLRAGRLLFPCSGIQIVTAFGLGIEPRHRSLEELKGEDAGPAVLKQAS
jgi:hypothetical protein